MSLQALLAVFLGGGLGSVARYLVSAAAIRAFGAAFPFGTLIVNVVGSAAMGVLSVVLFSRLMPDDLRDPFRLFLMTGFLGGFTTFSAFSLDLHTLIARGDTGLALAYGAGSFALSLAALVGAIIVMRGLVA